MKKGEVKAGSGEGAVMVKPKAPKDLLAVVSTGPGVAGGGFKESKPQVIAGTAGVVHKNPSKTPTVVADTSVKEHLYGWGGIRNNVLGSKGGSTDSIGDKDQHPKSKGTKTQTNFIAP